MGEVRVLGVLSRERLGEVGWQLGSPEGPELSNGRSARLKNDLGRAGNRACVELWFPTLERIVRIHERILQESGGETGILSRGPIEAAVARVRAGPFPIGEPTVWVRAALLLRGIAQDHPFIDGNKRTAYEVSAVFLRNNGFVLEPSMEEARDFMVEVAKGERSLQEIARWLRQNSRNV